jgi:hypothetical protein
VAPFDVVVNFSQSVPFLEKFQKGVAGIRSITERITLCPAVFHEAINHAKHDQNNEF